MKNMLLALIVALGVSSISASCSNKAMTDACCKHAEKHCQSHLDKVRNCCNCTPCQQRKMDCCNEIAVCLVDCQDACDMDKAQPCVKGRHHREGHKAAAACHKTHCAKTACAKHCHDAGHIAEIKGCNEGAHGCAKKKSKCSHPAHCSKPGHKVEKHDDSMGK